MAKFQVWDTAFLPPPLESNLGGEMFWDLGMVVSGRWGRVLPRAQVSLPSCLELSGSQTAMCLRIILPLSPQGMGSDFTDLEVLLSCRD